jgi:hypothetical protein
MLFVANAADPTYDAIKTLPGAILRVGRWRRRGSR